MAKVAINGFGRIGMAFFKLALDRPELEIIAINDLSKLEDLANLLRHDSVYDDYNKEVSVQNSKLVVDGKEFLFLQERDATKLPWADLGADIVVEATGAFESYKKASAHKKAGAKRVVITAPAEDEDGSLNGDGRTVLMGINEEELKNCTISSNGSCTTNSAASIMQILSEKIGVKKAFLNTTHAYTPNQAGVKEGVIIPAETGAAMAIDRVVTSLKGKFDGYGLRVPVKVGAISVITLVLEKTTTTEEVNEILKASAAEPRWQGILKTISNPIVSSDIIGNPYPAIADLSLTKVIDGDLCTVYSWYDNEFGYVNSLFSHVLKVVKLIK